LVIETVLFIIRGTRIDTAAATRIEAHKRGQISPFGESGNLTGINAHVEQKFIIDTEEIREESIGKFDEAKPAQPSRDNGLRNRATASASSSTLSNNEEEPLVAPDRLKSE
jgi:hypothetical protein